MSAYRRTFPAAITACLVCSTALVLGTGCATTAVNTPPPATAIYHHMASHTAATAASTQSPISMPEIADPGTGFRAAMDAFAAGDHERAALLCRGMMERYPESPWKRRSHFLLGRTFLARNMTADAEEALQRVAAEYPDFADYALFLLAEHLRTRQRPADAAAIWHRLATHYPSSLLVPRALTLRAQALMEAGLHKEAVSAFEQVLREYPRSDAAADAAFGLGTARVGAADLAGAAQAFQLVKIKYPSPERDQTADRAIARLADYGIEAPRMTAEELLERARNLYRSSQFDRAQISYLAVLDRDPAHSQKAEILLRSGIALYNIGRRVDSAAVLERLLKAKLPDCRCAEALHWLGKSYSRLGMREEAVRTFLRLTRDHPDSDWADDALYLAGNVYRDAGDMNKALVYYRRLTAEYPESSFADSALWWEGWNAYSAGEYSKSISVLREIVRRYPRSFLVNQALYWMGRSADASGDQAAAAAHYRRVLSHGPYTYYGTLAAQRLERSFSLMPASLDLHDGAEEQDSDQTEDGEVDDDGLLPQGSPPAWTEDAIEALSSNPSYRRTLELMYLGMKKEAAAELWSLLDLMPGRSGAVLGLSKAFFELGDYHSSIIIVLRNFERLLERPSERLPEDLWRLAYPQGFWPNITSSAKKYGLDPYFVAAIIREESQFRPDAVSPAGARGVMQVMPSTGEWIARNTGISGFERSRLFEAETNISLGAWYLAHLMKKFNGSLTLVSASYNAGPEPVMAWSARPGGTADPAVFVEMIPYAETRGYVKKVLRNYAEYRRLYGTAGQAMLSPAGYQGKAGVPSALHENARLCKAGGCP